MLPGRRETHPRRHRRPRRCARAPKRERQHCDCGSEIHLTTLASERRANAASCPPAELPVCRSVSGRDRSPAVARVLSEIAALEQPCGACSSCARRQRRSNVIGLAGGMAIALAILLVVGASLELFFFRSFPSIGQN